MKEKTLMDHVIDAGIYTALDYEYAKKSISKAYDNMGGGCTAVAKYTEDGRMLVGRNMDLNISHNPAYIVRTKVPGCYETVGLSYTFKESAPTYEYVLENGIPEEFKKTIPFLSCDIMNEKGLYVEINMRSGELTPEGEPKYSCTGTNPESKERVHAILLTRYIGEHCKDVEEAVAYAKSLDIYTAVGGFDAWNFCFMIADAGGRYGLLEIAQNKVVWNEGQPVQANFYVTPEFAENELMKAGTDRYRIVMEGRDGVQNRGDMFELINSVSYHQIYSYDNCGFDYRSEFIGVEPHWTYDYVTAEENRAEIDAYAKDLAETLGTLPRSMKQDRNTMWESVFTVVADCSERSLAVRFFEDDDRKMRLIV